MAVDDLKNKIIHLRKLGKTYKEIRAELHCTKSVISYHLKEQNLHLSSNRLIPTEEQKIKINELYNAGKKVKEIAEILGKERHCISKYILVKREKIQTISRSASVVSWRKRKKAALVEEHGGKCVLCGYNRYVGALHFHHLKPEEKEFRIGGTTLSIEKLKSEAQKCILVCMNCHTEIHHGIRLVSETGITSDC